MKIFRLRSFEEYKEHVEKNRTNYEVEKNYESSVIKPGAGEFTVRGISYPANQYVDFKVDYRYSDGKNINWRERMVCPVTDLNTRLRCCVHILDFELGPYPGSVIYITEQVTPLFRFLSKKFTNLIGSEYLGNDLRPGMVRKGIRHEDMTNLSFNNESIDHFLSFECFEHIPFYKRAITEAHRVLTPGGVFLGSFPFDRNSYSNTIKATIDDNGNIIYFSEPEYHGDPVSDKGILCYTIFGWEILDEFRQGGFDDVYAILIWSDIFGYLGGEQVFFIAKKKK
jgi:SAM-dependent methyltransferase